MCSLEEKKNNIFLLGLANLGQFSVKSQILTPSKLRILVAAPTIQVFIDFSKKDFIVKIVSRCSDRVAFYMMNNGKRHGDCSKERGNSVNCPLLTPPKLQILDLLLPFRFSYTDG